MDCASPRLGSVMVARTSSVSGRHWIPVNALPAQSAAVHGFMRRAFPGEITPSSTSGLSHRPSSLPTRVRTTMRSLTGSLADFQASAKTCPSRFDKESESSVPRSRTAPEKRSTSFQRSGILESSPVRSNHTSPYRCVANRASLYPERKSPCPIGTLSSMRMPRSYSLCSALAIISLDAPTAYFRTLPLGFRRKSRTSAGS